jgi:glutathione synthase
MAQGYLPAIKDGDKRILMIDGEPVDYCLARIPAGRNPWQPGRRWPWRSAAADRQGSLDRRASRPDPARKGLLFVGLDVIGEHLTEINVTSPTCIREIDNAFGTDIGGMLMDAIDKKLQAASHKLDARLQLSLEANPTLRYHAQPLKTRCWFSCHDPPVRSARRTRPPWRAPG